MRAWWDGLQARERLILIGGGIVAAVIILWAAVWNPLFVNTAELAEDLVAKERLLADLTRLEATMSTTAPTRPTGRGGSLVVVVDQTINHYAAIRNIVNMRG